MPTPLELATSARVACAALEAQIERGHHRKALATARKLWERIGAMAGAIEELSDEVEQLRYLSQLAGPEAVNVPSIQILPDPGEPVPEWTVTSDVPDDEPPVIVSLGQRPPGFERIRERMQHRENPCALVELPEDKPPRQRKKKNSAYHVQEWRNGRQRELGPPWQRVQQAYLAGEIEAGQIVTSGELFRICSVYCATIECLQMDLCLNRAPLRLIHQVNGKFLVRAA